MSSHPDRAAHPLTLPPGRGAGVLLHPTSLPGPFGCGDLGVESLNFLDWLAQAGQNHWQILPLTPPDGTQSPYTSLSVHAGNPLLISPQRLAEDGLLDEADLAQAAGALAHTAPDRIDFGITQQVRTALLEKASATFFAQHPDLTSGADPLPPGWIDGPGPDAPEALPATAPSSADGPAGRMKRFCRTHQHWLADYALFMALSEAHGYQPWPVWDGPLAQRDPAALQASWQQYAARIRHWIFLQWTFDEQWQRVRLHARDRGIRIIGDIPIYCAHNSADVWTRPDLFQLDAQGRCTQVAGVPPDYFSADGQKWGNPLYDWAAHKAERFEWWSLRLASMARQADIARIDHFRAFAGYWAVPESAPTAATGQWLDGPGEALFQAVQGRVELPLIAEDLGIITPDVTALRKAIGAPGMAVLQFAFGDDAHNSYLPHNVQPDTVIYTGTHDNNTTLGWFASIPAHERERVQQYLQTDGQEIHWDLICTAMRSVARLAIWPVQDVAGLDGQHRMNSPGQADGQWGWRLRPDALQPWQTQRLALLSRVCGRV